MLKKLSIFLIAVVYLSISSGIAINIHYCMNRIAAVSLHLGEQDEDACGTCGMDKENNHCCKDVIKVVKLSDNHQPATVIAKWLLPMVQVPVLLTDYTTALQGQSIHPPLQYFSPPSPTFNKVYKANRVFRI